MDKTTRTIVIWIGVVVGALLLISGYNRPMTLKLDVEKQLGIQAYELVRQADVVSNAQSGFGAIVGLDNATVLGLVKEAEALRKTVAIYCDKTTGTCDLPNDPETQAAITQQMAAFQQASIDVIAYSQTHPQLRAADAFDTFMISVEGSANRVAVQGGVIQESISRFKNFCINFPGSLFCGMRGVSADDFKFYHAPEAKQEMPSPAAIPTITMP